MSQLSDRWSPRPTSDREARRHLLSVTACFAIGSAILAALVYWSATATPSDQQQGGLAFVGMWVAVLIPVCGIVAFTNSVPLWRVPLVRVLWLLLIIAALLLSLSYRFTEGTSLERWVTLTIAAYSVITFAVSGYGFYTAWRR